LEGVEREAVGQVCGARRELFPAFTAELNEAMQMETDLTLESPAQTGGSVLRLLNS
jgi:hypothetical protein